MTAGRTARRVVVTGVGAVAAGGTGREAFWERIVAGRPAIRRITRFDASRYRSRIAAEADFDPLAAGLTPRETHRTGRFAQFALAAAAEALDDSGLRTQTEDADRVGVCLGTAVGADVTERHPYTAGDGGADREAGADHGMPFAHRATHPASVAAELSLRHGLHGPSSVVTTGCTSGLDAIGCAFRTLSDGEADVMLAGAAEAPISPVTAACFDAIGATTAFAGDPGQAPAPFDARRDGFVLGEGGAVLVLEELEHARARDASVYCEVRGWDNRTGAYHMTGLRPDGYDLGEAIISAMSEAGIVPEQLDWISAHGAGTVQSDRYETAAYKRALGEHARKVPVSSVKPVIGHCLGAAGALEMAACALAVRRGVIPPTANLLKPDPRCDLDYTPVLARERRVRHALSVACGLGGFHSAMVFSALEPDPLREARA
ncbi:beta-ketoacyl-[acyl-carrier-protein] synthase family protein [Streptomyces sp. ME01-24h]|nr:beta-ketoacyl-[acyl-carrier-protein] synthase family protein [Streptomyces sp. ME19-03-3]MDX3354651.1 beta-ketoacyl-[acyl-carrier-protein] synthase family protein [Streptomyces sp. ME01-24h]